MKIGWLSDIHLSFLEDEDVSAFITRLRAEEVDGWVISGDIGESDNVLDYLDRLASGLGRPVYFVLGNHDYYFSSIADVSSMIDDAVSGPGLVWLTSSRPVILGHELAITGDDGWGDARFGDPLGSTVELNDFELISEITDLIRPELIRRLNELGDACYARLAPKLEEAASRCRNVCIVTHVPPFEGAAWYGGRPSGPEWLPWFSCEASGRAILECAMGHPETDFLVLCGHTHGEGYYEASHNVRVYTAGARYENPVLQGIAEVDGGRIDVRLNRRQ